MMAFRSNLENLPVICCVTLKWETIRKADNCSTLEMMEKVDLYRLENDGLSRETGLGWFLN